MPLGRWGLFGLVAFATVSRAQATDYTQYMTSTFDLQFERALLGSEFGTHEDELEAAVDSALRAHFERIHVPYTRRGVDRSILALAVDYVGDEHYSIEVGMDDGMRARYEVAVTPAGVTSGIFVAAERRVQAGDRLYHASAQTQQKVLAEMTILAGRADLNPYDLNLRLAVILPTSGKNRRAFVHRLSRDSGIRVPVGLDYGTDSTAFAFGLIEALDRAGFWKPNQRLAIVRIAELAAKYADRTVRAIATVRDR